LPSPFPGMNPYIEQDDAWHDFHERFLPLAAERIGAQVLPRYIVKIDEHIYIHENPQEPRIERLCFLEIRDRRSRELITVVELLSPSNKRAGPDRDQYLAKRSQVLASSAHLVEIDLLRGGAPMPAANRPPCDYSAMVSLVEERPDAAFWPIGLRDRLPVIPIPVRAQDPSAWLDIQEILDHIYDTGGYALSGDQSPRRSVTGGRVLR
jgi:hypothetical protein